MGIDLTPILIITLGTFIIVLIVFRVLRCKHSWEHIQEGIYPDGKKYEITRCKFCGQFEKNSL